MDTLLLHNNSKGIMELGALLLSLTGVTKPAGDNPSVLGLTQVCELNLDLVRLLF